MTYVLVHLVGDQASEHAGRLVEHLERARTPTCAFRGESPPHDDVATACTTGPTSAVCIGHGSPAGLGPDRNRVWADADRLGEVFRERRLYAYACNTTGDLGSLGARAVRAGVAVFVGHDRIIEAPLPPQERRMVAQVASAAILAFVGGQDDERALLAVIHDVGDTYLAEEINLDYREDGNWFSQSKLFDELAFSLRVHRRSPEHA
jgi:hypothetical protein